jgi:hypothetical protein
MEVYSVFGHGCDTVEEKEMPENCILITLAYCGMSTKIFSLDETKKSIFQVFTEDFSKGEHFLKDPIQYQDILREKYGPIHIHYRKEGYNTTYTDIEYTFPLGFCVGLPCKPKLVQNHTQKYDYKKNGESVCECLTYQSGLRKIGKPVKLLTMTSDIMTETYKDAVDPSLKFIDVSPIEGDIQTIYETLGKRSDSVSLSSYLDIYPGIYYHFTCRNGCNNDILPSAIELRREKSAMFEPKPVARPPPPPPPSPPLPKLTKETIDKMLHDQQLDELTKLAKNSSTDLTKVEVYELFAKYVPDDAPQDLVDRHTPAFEALQAISSGPELEYKEPGSSGGKKKKLKRTIKKKKHAKKSTRKRRRSR